MAVAGVGLGEGAGEAGAGLRAGTGTGTASRLRPALQSHLCPFTPVAPPICITDGKRAALRSLVKASLCGVVRAMSTMSEWEREREARGGGGVNGEGGRGGDCGEGKGICIRGGRAGVGSR